MKPTKCPEKEKNEARKAKNEGKSEKKKKKRRKTDCCVTFKPQNYLECLLSAHAQTLQANILHLDQKAVKSTACKCFISKF